MKLTKKAVLSFVFVLSLNGVNAQEKVFSKFPSWMDKVNFNNSFNQTNEFNTPTEPIDPETGQRAANTSLSKKFKPKLPDFKKLREKALKAKLEKKQNINIKENNKLTVSVKNLNNLKVAENNLDNQIRMAASDILKNTLLAQRQKLQNKIRALEEVKTLMQRQKSENLTEEQSAKIQNRIQELASYLFNFNKVKLKVPTPPTPLIKTNVRNKATFKIPSRFYRPTPIKSFYLQSKQKEEQTTNE